MAELARLAGDPLGVALRRPTAVTVYAPGALDRERARADLVARRRARPASTRR